LWLRRYKVRQIIYFEINLKKDVGSMKNTNISNIILWQEMDKRRDLPESQKNIPLSMKITNAVIFVNNVITHL